MNMFSLFPARCLALFLMLGALSCGREATIPDHLDDDFVHGADEGLYRIRDLTLILDPDEVKSKRSARAGDLKNYRDLLSERENLYEDRQLKASISSLEELLRIRTAQKGTKVKISSGMENIFIDPAIPFLNEYELLDYTIIEPRTRQQKILKKLLGTVRDFKGFPNTDYYILPHFTGNYLILYKLAEPDKLPYDELPLARRVGDLLAVPLVGYPVEYCEAVRFLDSNQRKTLKSRPLCKAVKHSAQVSYIRLKTHGKQVFKYLEKQDLFERDFFDGRWVHFQTFVRSPFTGTSTIEHTTFKPSQIVEFRPATGKMDVVEVFNLKEEDEERVLFIPVKWVDYEIAGETENPDKSFSEKPREDTYETRRPYLKINFDRLIENEFGTHEETGGGKSLKSVVITEDYISFDIEITINGLSAYMIKYAFKRYIENSGYIEKRWFKRDSLLFFPVPWVKRKYYKDPADHSLSDEHRLRRVIRFNPKSKKILWHFSNQTSQLQWIRDLGRLAVDLVNKALKEAGRGSEYEIEMVLDENGADKEVGDIRYNILNMILSEGETVEQFNMGWNVADPVTGEVVSATANVWVNQILKEYVSLLRRYIRFHVYPPAWKMKPFSRETADFIRSAKMTNLQCGDLSRPPLGVTAFLHEKINSVCTDVSRFIQKEKRMFHPKGAPLQDAKIVASCAQKLARVKVLQATVHSILRSLGMKDMFSASADRENFYKHDEMQKLFGRSHLEMATASHPDPPQYSSVMDRMDFEYPVLPVPGKWDIEALRFIYFDKVKKANGGFLHVPSGADRDPNNPQKSILEAAGSEKLKEHKVCGWEGSPWFCKSYDYGVSPLEITSNNICKAHNSAVSGRNRYDGKEVEKGKYSDTIRSIRMLYSKWEEYRDDILAEKNKSVSDYTFLNPEHIEEYNQIMESAGNHPDIRPHYEIRGVIFDYFKRLIFAPAKHCIYKERSRKDGKFRYRAVALEVIEEKILRQYPENSDRESEVFMSCESQIVKDWAGKDKQMVAETGFFGDDKRYFIRPNEKIDPVDEVSVFQSEFHAFSNMLPGILNEPDLGAEYYKEWRAYITEGIDLNPYIDREAIKDPDTPKGIRLNRVLSYKIDTRITEQKGVALNNLWLFRMRGVKDHREKINRPHSRIENLELFPVVFDYRIFSSTDLTDYAESAQTHSGLHDIDIPFLTQVYREYTAGLTAEERERISFAGFIQEHPAVIYKPDDSVFLLPYVDEPSNVKAVLFRRHNEFLTCVNEHDAGAKNCEDVENKRAFIQFMLETDLLKR